ncbi:branched-chain amino acid transport system II carrier protein [Actinomyces sp. 186855]|nr:MULTISPECIES: branched-chain amino acid transport system II carrier protein [unclassified Actinomyces]MCL3776687.1 branched-chain amino acid transport system II carrier protein [Actinomyces sp. AC-20-1]MCL3789794.1 branched-chain amino acid transport system II carrier protein [Actinomyces sp. 187325]MCL3793056.1 branched-chain amino acid transport system II carrier protein [Actinomyces sp. 186855]MCL3794610.1 branched-chain amino acid transport system II carrier protein [Actinomyces sp. 2178
MTTASGGTAPGPGAPALRGAVTTGLMLFALFFGAGNLIFPPALGASSGGHLPLVLTGFIVTGVLLPLLAVIAVCTSGEGVLGLAHRVGPRFGALMPLAVYLSIGPLYGVPRVATVAYELATRPVLVLAGIEPGRWALALHCLVFFVLTVWVALSPARLADRIGKVLTPALLGLLTVLFAVTFLPARASGAAVERGAVGEYAAAPLTTGLTQGYLTMDVLAATVFGIVVISSLRQQGRTTVGQVARSATLSGVVAAALLATVYVGLALVGARTPGEDVSDGTALLRTASAAGLGSVGVVVFAGIVLLACLTTSVGLLSSWAGYASTAWRGSGYRPHLLAAATVSLMLANLGLSTILAVISPLTLLLYPVTITLVVVTLVDALAPGHLRSAYTWPAACALALGLVSALHEVGWTAPSELLGRSGLWNDSTGWILPTLAVGLAALAWDVHRGRWSTPASDDSGTTARVERIISGQTQR